MESQQDSVMWYSAFCCFFLLHFASNSVVCKCSSVMGFTSKRLPAQVFTPADFSHEREEYNTELRPA